MREILTVDAITPLEEFLLLGRGTPHYVESPHSVQRKTSPSDSSTGLKFLAPAQTDKSLGMPDTSIRINAMHCPV
jgi:hypothetical protein